MKSKKIWIIAVLALIVLVALAYFLTRSGKSPNSQNTQGFPAPLSINKNVELEKDRSTEQVVGPDGAVFWVMGSDQTLYTLTVPEDAIILPSTVIMTPLKKAPFNNYSKASFGNGVLLSGKFTFIRPVYLTVQKNAILPTDLTNTGARPWGRCNIGSRGYDPEVCAADKKIVFGSGIEPGKVMIMGSTEYERILLNPTIPTGDGSINAMVWRPGYYMADRITAKEAADLAQITFAGSNDYVNQTEVLMHLYKMKGDLKAYASQIARFEREKGDYQREVVKGAILAKAIGNQKAYEARIDELFKEREQLFNNFRAAFVPSVRYIAFMEQFRQTARTSWLNFIFGIKKAYASKWQLPDYNPNGSGSDSSSDNSGEGFWDRLQDYNPFKEPESNPGDDLPDYEEKPPQDGDNLPDYPGDNIPPQDNEDENDDSDWGTPSDEPSEDASDEIRRRDEQRRKEEENRLRNIIGGAAYNCSEKLDAIESIFRIGNLSDQDLDAIAKVIEKCMNSCATPAQCEQTGDFGNRTGNAGAIAAANYRIMAFMEKNTDCTDLKWKTLETYGKNFCAGKELW